MCMPPSYAKVSRFCFNVLFSLLVVVVVKNLKLIFHGDVSIYSSFILSGVQVLLTMFLLRHDCRGCINVC